MNRLLLSILSLALLTGVRATADKIEKPPLPAGELLKRAPDFSKWTVIYSYPESKPAKGGDSPKAGNPGPVRLATLTVTKTKNIYVEQKTYTDGSVKQSWRLGDMQICFSDFKTVNIYDRSSFPSADGELLANPELYTDYSKTDFPGLEWVSARNYAGVQTLNDVECLVFRENPPINPANPTAYIDLQTRLPVRLVSQESTNTYTFDPTPPVPISLPPEIQQLLESRAKAIKSMTTASPSY